MALVFEVVKWTWESQNLLLTQEAITANKKKKQKKKKEKKKKLDLFWEHGTAGERFLSSSILAYEEINRAVSPITLTPSVICVQQDLC